MVAQLLEIVDEADGAEHQGKQEHHNVVMRPVLEILDVYKRQDVTPEAAQEPESDVTEADIVPEEPAAEAPAADEEQPKE